MKSSGDSNELAQQILEVVPLIMRIVSADMRQTEQVQSTSHFHVLWILRHCSMSLSELAEKSSVSLPTMSNSITIMEDRGWVNRVRDEQDRRKVLIEITPSGLDALGQVMLHAQKRVVQLLDGVSAEDQETLSRGLLILRDIFLKAAEFMPAPHQRVSGASSRVASQRIRFSMKRER